MKLLLALLGSRMWIRAMGDLREYDMHALVKAVRVLVCFRSWLASRRNRNLN